MSTEPIEPQRTPRHTYSARGVGLRVLLLGAMLTSLAVALTGGQRIDAWSIDGREVANDSAIGRASDGAPAGSDGPPGGLAPAASASPSAGPSGVPPDDWHLYHHWTDPSWPDAGQATGEQPDLGDVRAGGATPIPAGTAGGNHSEPQATPTIDPTPPAGWTPTPGGPTDPAPGTPTGAPTITGPEEEPGTPTPPGGNAVPPGSPGQDGTAGPRPSVSAGDPLGRDPVAAVPDDDLGLGETVDEPTPTPEPTAGPGAGTVPLRVADPDTTPAGEYHQTLIYSGLVGLALAAIGLTMVGLRRRRW